MVALERLPERDKTRPVAYPYMHHPHKCLEPQHGAGNAPCFLSPAMSRLSTYLPFFPFLPTDAHEVQCNVRAVDLYCRCTSPKERRSTRVASSSPLHTLLQRCNDASPSVLQNQNVSDRGPDLAISHNGTPPAAWGGPGTRMRVLSWTLDPLGMQVLPRRASQRPQCERASGSSRAC